MKVKETDELVLAIEGKNLVTKQELDYEVRPYLTVTLTCTGLDVKGNEAQVDGEITVCCEGVRVHFCVSLIETLLYVALQCI